MSFPLSKPPFVVIEGLDGAGTTTQTEQVARELIARGQPVAQSCEPSAGPVGSLIRKMLSRELTVPDTEGGERPVGRETLALLFAADRLHHLESDVEPALARGEVAISDRYYHSSLAYQGDVDGTDSADFEWVQTLNERARRPDLTIFLEASAELCLERLADRSEHDIFESRDKLERLQRRYDEVMDLLAGRGERIVRLDATASVQAITSDIVDAIGDTQQSE